VRLGAGYNSKAGHDDGTETVEYTNPTLDSEPHGTITLVGD